MFVLCLYRCCKSPSLTFDGQIFWDVKQAGHGVDHAISSNTVVEFAFIPPYKSTSWYKGILLLMKFEADKESCELDGAKPCPLNIFLHKFIRDNPTVTK
jgi:hypothetical protein